jgi:hypothetical protein
MVVIVNLGLRMYLKTPWPYISFNPHFFKKNIETQKNSVI